MDWPAVRVIARQELTIHVRSRWTAIFALVFAALASREFDLLAFMMRNRGRVFTRDQLLSQIWGYDFAGDTRTVDVHVRWLRKKIEDEPGSPRRLITVRGTGYRFDG